MFKICLMLAISVANVAFAEEPYKLCKDDLARLEARSKELQEIVNADQDERTPEKFKEWAKIGSQVKNRDLLRRKRVADIFAEGCFSKAADYAAAALVFQHGDTPDHFFQTYIWSKRGMELGDEKQGQMLANGIDRYLVNIGHKVLFASQAYRDEKTANSCWCLNPVEKTFPDKKRIEIKHRNYKEALAWLDDLNEHRKDCPREECKGMDVKATPKGTVPGLW
jgi:hypothetical protein